MEKCGCGGGRSRSSLALLAIGFYAILAHWDVRKYAIVGIVPPPTDRNLTKERRKKDVKNDVENGVNEGKKLCPIFGTLSHLWYIKNNTNRVLDRTQSRRRSPTI